eukprot:GFKZ01003731.1.p2 GENE.GFKZ01003731.1~~GFKZ01003731.1.p2  ORF type:complete len:234 (-),score=35.05 GFKZ01003731.1:4349-5050(-)
MWTEMLPSFIHLSAPGWVSTSPLPLQKRASRWQHTYQPLCSLKYQSSIPTHTVQSVRNSSRRAFLLAVAFLTTTGAEVFKASAAAELFETFTFSPLKIVIEYPKSWFRSERRGSLVIVNLKDVIAATVSRKALRLERTADAFSMAYDFVRDRIEEEGSELILKEASFDEDGALMFRFRTETLKPNGDVVQRVGVGKGVTEGDEAVVCIVTGPKEGWGEVEEVATRVVGSLRVI